MKIAVSVIILALLSVASACSQRHILPGIYTGTFTAAYDSATVSGKTTVVFTDSTYTCEGNDNRIPAGGSGSYSVTNSMVTFRDENMWTADFDWNLILQGTYQYTFDGSTLRLSRRGDHGAQYEYLLRKK